MNLAIVAAMLLASASARLRKNTLTMENAAAAAGAKVKRSRDKARCQGVMNDATKEICFISGGRNPEVDGHKDQYHLQTWADVFKINGGGAEIVRDCYFCGVAGIYKKCR